MKLTDERITEMAMTHQSAHALARAIEAEVRAECESLQAKVAELEKVALAYEEQIVLHNKTLDELKYTGLAAAAEAKRGDELQSQVAEQAALIEKCEHALNKAYGYGTSVIDVLISEALAAIAAHREQS